MWMRLRMDWMIGVVMAGVASRIIPYSYKRSAREVTFMKPFHVRSDCCDCVRACECRQCVCMYSMCVCICAMKSASGCVYCVRSVYRISASPLVCCRDYVYALWLMGERERRRGDGLKLKPGNGMERNGLEWNVHCDSIDSTTRLYRVSPQEKRKEARDEEDADVD